jgi:hypothetical protein
MRSEQRCIICGGDAAQSTRTVDGRSPFCLEHKEKKRVKHKKIEPEEFFYAQHDF